MVKNTVILTGFGPFKEHKINASWEAVKLVPDLNDEEIDIIIEEVPVTYKAVEEQVKRLWEKHKPTLVIHVGVSSLASKIIIETKACRSGYLKTDCIGQLHPTGEVCAANEGNDVIYCAFDVSKICAELNQVYGNTVACSSANAGRYLCEYIYYKSLNVNDKRTLFVHVPPIDKPFSAEELARGLFLIIKTALKQLTCNCDVE